MSIRINIWKILNNLLKRGLSSSAEEIINLPRPAKRLLAVCVDIMSCSIAVWVSFYLRLGEFVSFNDPVWQLDLAIFISILIAIPVFLSFGLYQAIFRYSGVLASTTLRTATIVYALIFFNVIILTSFTGVPRTVGVIQPVVLYILLWSSRSLVKYWLGGAYLRILSQNNLVRVMIFGAGERGRSLQRVLIDDREMQTIGFIDDDPKLHGRLVNGLKVYNPDQFERLSADLKVDCVLLALPAAKENRKLEILHEMARLRVKVKIFEGLRDEGVDTQSSRLREVKIEDVLGREPIPPNPLLMRKKTFSKRILVTGAGGTIGSEIARKVFSLGPSVLILLDSNEFALYKICEELAALLGNSESLDPAIVIPVLGSVTNRDLMVSLYASNKIQVVYHAAAYKHVSLVEQNPVECLINNVTGTYCAVTTAAETGVEDFVLISTDKAVKPTSIMGASKRISELGLQALSQEKSLHKATVGCKFSIVRFGNVLESSGSVIPKFREQIKGGGPITVTDPRATRFFMTISEAAELVIQAGAMANGGDIFILDMGSPVNIGKLAEQMIELSGYTVKTADNPNGDIEIKKVGLKVGEKLTEELVLGKNISPTRHPRIKKAREPSVSWQEFLSYVEEIEQISYLDSPDSIKAKLMKFSIDYQLTEYRFVSRDENHIEGVSDE